MINLGDKNIVEKIRRKLESHFGETIMSELETKIKRFADFGESEINIFQKIQFRGKNGANYGAISISYNNYNDELDLKKSKLETIYNFSGPIAILNPEYLFKNI